MSEIWFASDHHFFHDLLMILRKFPTIKTMHSTIIRRHNELVKPEDTVYFLGDFTIKSYPFMDPLKVMLNKMNGTKHLIFGNHEYFKWHHYIDMGFTSVHSSLEVEEFILVHDPSASIILPDRQWLCGHVHDLFLQCNITLSG